MSGIGVIPEWVVEAACAQTDPELFFPTKGGDAATPVSICAACPVRLPCLEWALAIEASPDAQCHGIWGGTTPNERAAMLARRPATRCPDCGATTKPALDGTATRCAMCRHARRRAQKDAYEKKRPTRRTA